MLDERRDDLEAALEQRLESVPAAVRPRLRGWLHAGAFPLSLASGIALVILASGRREVIASAVFAVTAIFLFGTSAVYHRGDWSPRVKSILKRWDHANIFLIIAGTYTPFTELLLPRGQARTLLWIIWSGAVAGAAFRVLWLQAPRWLYVPVYVAMGWVAVAYLPGFLNGGGVAVLVLIVVGGLLYTLGGIVYGTKWPDPSPAWFGFHEIFHAFTIAAFATHTVAVWLAVLQH
ncbi:MAG: hemolysin III family protein [Kineosporiaceae bacterium]